MLISSLRLESKALKAFREDDSDTYPDDNYDLSQSKSMQIKKIQDEIDKDHPNWN